MAWALYDVEAIFSLVLYFELDPATVLCLIRKPSFSLEMNTEILMCETS